MSQHTPSLSFEVFPPNPEVGNAKLLRALANMQELAPHFISVTASNNKYNIKETTVALANYIQNELSIPTIAHLPAVYLSKEKVADTLHELDEVGVHRILALRGDIIPGVEPLKDFRYATDLIEFIKTEAPHFEVIGACYPEGHPDSPNQISDIQNLKKKVDAGCSSLVTQLFFDNELVVESKGSNQGLLDAVLDLNIKEDNKYYIAFDYVVDNQDIRNKYRMLKSITDKSDGKIVILDMICFEYLILAFDKLVEWTGTGKTYKIKIREKVLGAVENHRIDLSRIDDEKTLQYIA